MSRKYGRLMLSVWKDKDYKALSLANQGLFCGFLAYPGISWCGVIDNIPKRLVEISDELTMPELANRIDMLCEAGFLVLDTDTDEILIRRFVYYDGVLKMPNVAKAMAKAVEKIQSPLIRDVMISELARLRNDEPHLGAWGEKGLIEGFGELLDEIESAAELALGHPDPALNTNPSRNPSPNPSADPWDVS